ncbi:MAG: RHS repeat-associated core domain-containing protein [Verrucomicrobiales bacterium]|nr:RHS repeat-associated core domain-containing protein [Verrucomicrobiales bacterium]
MVVVFSFEKGGETETFTLDQTFAYDAAGNRKEIARDGMTATYQSNAANQYAQIATGTEVVEPVYDELGNLLEDDRNTYTWDADIHLMSVTRKAGDSPASATEFRYDPLHRRLARVTESETTLFIYDGWNVIAENTAISNPQSEISNPPQQSARLVWAEDLSSTLQGADGIGGLMSSRLTPEKDQHPTTYLFHYDSNGNVILLTSAADATPAARYAYDALTQSPPPATSGFAMRFTQAVSRQYPGARLGQTLTATGLAAHVNRYQFSTKPIERGSGLAYFGFRYYDPVTGRWPSRDPIEEKGGFNLYGFVNNETISESDVLGFGIIHWLAKAAISEMLVILAGIIQNHCAELVGDSTSKETCTICCRATSAIGAGSVFTTWAIGVVESFAAGIVSAGVGGIVNMMPVTGTTVLQVAQLVDSHQSCIDDCEGCPIL